MKKCLLMLSGIVMTAGMLYAQPVNDNCTDAIPMNYADTEGELVLVTGDTRGGTFDAAVPNDCSATWTGDDIWFTLTLPAVLPPKGVIVRAYFGTEPDDVPAVGMAFFPSCGGSATQCFSSDDPSDDRMIFSSNCLEAGGTYIVRMWSGGSATDFSGTFRIGAYAYTDSDVVLWEEDFADGMGGWTTFGTCGGDPDSNANAVWHYLPMGVLDRGAYANPGVGVVGSLTACNGGVGVDSDYDDNAGIEGAFGTGPCPTGNGSQYIIESPVLAHADWGVAGISIKWIQGLREFNSEFFVGYRIYENGAWTAWRSYEVNGNDEFPTNSAHFNNDEQRVFMGGAHNGDSLQIRFVYDANYYYWGIDDISLIEAPCTDMRSMGNFYAIAPAALMPEDQIVPWWPLNDVYNAGACEQTNVNLNFTLKNSQDMEVYNENLSYGSIPADSLVENVNFATPVIVPSNVGVNTYTGTYTLTSDDATETGDFNYSDNMNTLSFSTTAGEYGLESGFTRALAPNSNNYDPGAPLGYVYGCYYYFPNGSTYEVKSVTWGANNPSDIAGLPINLILFKWIDVNENEQVEASERGIIAFAEVVFDGTEPDNTILETNLENFQNQGDPIWLEDNTAYLMVFEYRAVDQTSFFCLASEDYDYSAVVLSSSQAGKPTYASVLGLSADGNVDGIDYGVDAAGTFGFDIVPMMRMNMTKTDVKDVLPEGNLVSLYPNPASEKLNLDLEFTQRMENVQVIMLDAAGKSLSMDNYRDMDRATLQYDVSRLVPGAYMIHVATEKGSRAVPFVVQH